ncbi:hypothetical protein AB6H26_00325 [Providencia hangzhouensis]
MVYSYTEKKRIRKDFGKRPQVLHTLSPFYPTWTRSRSLSEHISDGQNGLEATFRLCFQFRATAVMLNYNMSAIV